MLDEFREVKLRIYESVYHNKISDEDADVLLEMVEDMECFYEMKSRTEYAKKKFLKKHDYDPKTNTISDGENGRIHVNDIKRKSPIETVVRKDTPESKEITDKYKQVNPLDGPRMNSRGDNHTVTLDKHFWKLKNDKRREGVLQHEYGHKFKHNNTSVINEEQWNSEFNQVKNQLYPNVDDKDLSDSDISKITNKVINKLGVTKTAAKINSKRNVNNAERDKKYLNTYNNYISKSYVNDHVRASEVEADDHAIKHTNTKDYKKGLNEISRSLNKERKRNEKVILDQLYNNLMSKYRDKLNNPNTSESTKKFIRNIIKNTINNAKKKIHEDYVIDDIELKNRNKFIDDYHKIK